MLQEAIEAMLIIINYSHEKPSISFIKNILDTKLLLCQAEAILLDLTTTAVYQVHILLYVRSTIGMRALFCP